VCVCVCVCVHVRARACAWAQVWEGCVHDEIKLDWKDEPFGIHWHSKCILHATSHKSLLHICNQRSLRNSVCLKLSQFLFFHNMYFGHCRVNVLLCYTGVFSNNARIFHCCTTVTLVTWVACLLGKMQQADMDGPRRCSSHVLDC
jgi:hypothetical protein